MNDSSIFPRFPESFRVFLGIFEGLDIFLVSVLDVLVPSQNQNKSTTVTLFLY